MFQVVVVEDSKPILRDISRQILAYDQSIAIRTAYDGESALKLLKSFEPDVLFSDIKLPIIDGLTLIQEAKSLYPNLKCVIISGYSDFEFTHEALKLQVDEYLLKPVDPEEFNRIMTDIFHEVKHTRLENEESALSDILCGFEGSSPVAPQSYIMSILHSGVIPKFASPLAKENVHACAWTGGENPVWVAETKNAGEKVVFFEANSGSPDAAQKHADCLYEALIKHYPHLNMISSEVINGIDDLRKQYLLLSNTLSSLIVLGKPAAYTANSQVSNRSLAELNEEVELFIKRMQGYIRGGLYSNFQSELHRQIQIWEAGQYPVIFTYRFVMALLMFLSNNLDNAGSLLFDDPHLQAEQLLAACSSYSDLEDRLLDCYDSYISRHRQRSDSSQELARRIERYLKNQIYGSLTIQDIAEKFQLSPSYISRLMKTYYKESPMDYYNQLKLNEARALLSQENILVKDVADILGFSDQHYFSKVFKKQFGINPASLKNNDYKAK